MFYFQARHWSLTGAVGKSPAERLYFRSPRTSSRPDYYRRPIRSHEISSQRRSRLPLATKWDDKMERTQVLNRNRWSMTGSLSQGSVVR